MVRLTLMLSTLLLLFGCTQTDETWNRIQRDGILRIGVDPTYPPFENLVDGQLVGLDIDLARALGETLDVDVHFDVIGYDGLYDALLIGRVDLLASALIIDETRTKTFAYSEPYFNAGQLLLTAADSEITSLAALSNKTVAVELGAAGHVVATQSDQPIQIETYSTADEAIAAVANGQAAATIVDAVSGRLALAATDQLQIANKAITVEPFALVVRRADGELLRQLDDALTTLTDSGELDAIIERWLGR